MALQYQPRQAYMPRNNISALLNGASNSLNQSVNLGIGALDSAGQIGSALNSNRLREFLGSKEAGNMNVDELRQKSVGFGGLNKGTQSTLNDFLKGKTQDKADAFKTSERKGRELAGLLKQSNLFGQQTSERKGRENTARNVVDAKNLKDLKKEVENTDIFQLAQRSEDLNQVPLLKADLTNRGMKKSVVDLLQTRGQTMARDGYVEAISNASNPTEVASLQREAIANRIDLGSTPQRLLKTETVDGNTVQFFTDGTTNIVGKASGNKQTKYKPTGSTAEVYRTATGNEKTLIEKLDKTKTFKAVQLYEKDSKGKRQKAGKKYEFNGTSYPTIAEANQEYNRLLEEYRSRKGK